MFEGYHTDKNTVHSYSQFYTNLIRHYNDKSLIKGTLLELGVRFGGGCAAFKHSLPGFSIIGVDSRDDINPTYASAFTFVKGNLFSEDVLRVLRGYKYDIIVDDMSHNISDMIVAFNTLSEYLHLGGNYVIEDISRPGFSIPFILSNLKDKDQYSWEHIDLSEVPSGTGHINRFDNHILWFTKHG